LAEGIYRLFILGRNPSGKAGVHRRGATNGGDDTTRAAPSAQVKDLTGRCLATGGIRLLRARAVPSVLVRRSARTPPDCMAAPQTMAGADQATFAAAGVPASLRHRNIRRLSGLGRGN